MAVKGGEWAREGEGGWGLRLVNALKVVRYCSFPAQSRIFVVSSYKAEGKHV